MKILESLDWDEVRGHYDERVNAQKRLAQLFDDRLVDQFVDLALGISNAAGNYSAAEHHLGPRILGSNGSNVRRRVLDLAAKLRNVKTADQVPALVQQAGISFLGIAVGSEISCLLNPKICWVANTRTIWTHLVVKHDGRTHVADEELKLYRDGDPSSLMAYRIWTAIHRDLRRPLEQVASAGAALAREAGVKPGAMTYLWADAIAGWLYAEHHA